MQEWLYTIASLATALGVIVAVWQLWLVRRQAVTSFEDDFSREYRVLAKDIPVAVLLGEEISPKEYPKVRELIYNYIDLSNEQAFLRQIGRVSRRTWEFWREGIQVNLKRPVFTQVWEEVKQRSPDSFHELRRLESERFTSDPKKWR